MGFTVCQSSSLYLFAHVYGPLQDGPWVGELSLAGVLLPVCVLTSYDSLSGSYSTQEFGPSLPPLV